MRPYAFLLYPFSVLYNLITKIRNWLFDLGWLKSTPTPIPSILVGNLSVGGTGKTPMVEYLIRNIKNQRKLATLSRGYGRKSSGFLKADFSSSPAQIGDEPFQIFQKFGKEISVFVGEKRLEAFQKISSNFPDVDLVVMDDAFQHRYVQADLSILLTTFDRPFFADYLLPMGRLRESRSGASRADMVVVTKTPNHANEKIKGQYHQMIKKYVDTDVPVLFSGIGYGEPYALGQEIEFHPQVILFSGLASDSHLKAHVSEHFEMLDVLTFSDHYEYQDSDFEKIRSLYLKYKSRNPVILTTEKDAVKVKFSAQEGILREIPIFVLPIQVEFPTEDAQQLERLIDQVILQK
ncbi:tetraacyldisaccharide 4'-kinase [Algoriphagus machipongonensis]|uniref:Tetraacyldisaccharide 4'-kinase n=1 Tax=Algoriphagus machipongonensis TaxID=388413 RepID=A3I0N1_9BACT|nr:tetraacyldisaccharide 4'-kinase [Algoriphagus machipongonensis]EAZ80027.1 tetraacyldisaccharide 4'-kinase [Algoriphagus machipongonensis]